MNQPQQQGEWNVAEWHGKLLVDRDGERIGKLQDIYVDIETDELQFATVKEGLIGRHLTFVPLGAVKIGPDELQVAVTKEQVQAAPISNSTARSSHRPTSRPSTTTMSSTTHPQGQKAAVASPAAEDSVNCTIKRETG